MAIWMAIRSLSTLSTPSLLAGCYHRPGRASIKGLVRELGGNLAAVLPAPEGLGYRIRAALGKGYGGIGEEVFVSDAAFLAPLSSAFPEERAAGDDAEPFFGIEGESDGRLGTDDDDGLGGVVGIAGFDHDGLVRRSSEELVGKSPGAGLTGVLPCNSLERGAGRIGGGGTEGSDNQLTDFLGRAAEQDFEVGFPAVCPDGCEGIEHGPDEGRAVAVEQWEAGGDESSVPGSGDQGESLILECLLGGGECGAECGGAGQPGQPADGVEDGSGSFGRDVGQGGHEELEGLLATARAEGQGCDAAEGWSGLGQEGDDGLGVTPGDPGEDGDDHVFGKHVVCDRCGEGSEGLVLHGNEGPFELPDHGSGHGGVVEQLDDGKCHRLVPETCDAVSDLDLLFLRVRCGEVDDKGQPFLDAGIGPLGGEQEREGEESERRHEVTASQRGNGPAAVTEDSIGRMPAASSM